MKKLIINETNHHGIGEYFFDGTYGMYSFDDDCSGNLRAAVELLLEIGFLKGEQVKIFSDDYSLIEAYADLLGKGEEERKTETQKVD